MSYRHSLHSHDLWPTVRRLSKKAKRRLAAVAYVSSDDGIRFGDGDLLVTDASRSAIASGQTSARVLMDAHQRGAAVYSLPCLHAKVLVFDDTTVIGSANISASSEHNLDEAAVVTDMPALVAPARALIEGFRKHAHSPLTATDLKRLLAIPVVRHGAQPLRRSRRVAVTADSRLWLITTREVDEDRLRAPTRRHMDEVMQEAAENAGVDKEDLCSIFTRSGRLAREVKIGDRIISIEISAGSRSRRLEVGPSSAIRSCRRYGGVAFIAFGAEPDYGDRVLPWKQFEMHARTVGIGRIGRTCSRLIPDELAFPLEHQWPD